MTQNIGGRLLDFSPLRIPQKGCFAKSRGPMRARRQGPFPCQPGHSEVSGCTGKLGVWLSSFPASLSHPKIAEVLSPLGRAVLESGHLSSELLAPTKSTSADSKDASHPSPQVCCLCPPLTGSHPSTSGDSSLMPSETFPKTRWWTMFLGQQPPSLALENSSPKA